jgi:formylglycine-generating enzyme required for sulfatase activity/serine/threonine protein kinase
MVDVEQLTGLVIENKYRLEKRLGAGGFGAVYRAPVVVAGNHITAPVAVKIINPAQRELKRLITELTLVANLEHDNLIRVKSHPGELVVRDSTGAEGTVFWFAMELADETLDDRLYHKDKARSSKGPLPEAEVMTMIRGVGQALAFLHGHPERLVHRDIKPANILRVGPTWKLGDLGLTMPEVKGSYSMLNATTVYLAPESLDDKAPRAAWDMWALGLTLVEAATGRPLWCVMTERQWTNLLTSDQELPLPELPAALAPIAAGCLAKDPQRRWTIAQVLQALAPETPRQTPRRPRVLPDAVEVVEPGRGWKGWLVVFVGLIGLSGWLVWPPSPSLTGNGTSSTAERPATAVAPTAPVAPAEPPHVVSFAAPRPQITVLAGSYPQAGAVFRDLQANGSACGDCPEMVVIPAGSFTMGSPESEPQRSSDESPQHRVTLAQPFAVGKVDVTFAEWDACVADGGCNGYRPVDQGWGRGRRPVINVSWIDAHAYAQWLSRKTGQTYRLPSEAEWEYAARAGTTTPFWWGSTITTDQANYDGNYVYNNGAKGVYRQKTVEVGSFKPNPFGLYDMAGNIYQWVEDTWHANYQGAPTDGSPWTTGDSNSARVVRGGSWDYSPDGLRSANRYDVDPDNRNSYIGFRLARTLPLKS